MGKILHTLVVEDSQEDTVLLLRALRRSGFETYDEPRVETETDFLKRLQGPVDLILSDYQMPRFSGLRALELLKSSGRDIPFIIVSGTIGEETAVQAMKLGADDYLVKGRLGRLGAAVTHALAECRRRQELTREHEERQKVELVLRESETKFREVVENIREVFWMLDADTRQMLYISPSYEVIWGCSCESLYKEPSAWLERIHPEDRDRVLHAALTKQIRGDYDEVYRIRRPDGSERWIRDTASTVRNREGRIYRIVGTAEDITEYRKLEEQYRHAQKLEAIGTLAGGIAHDFNNILTAITCYSQLAIMDSGSNASATAHMQSVIGAAKRASDLVRHILTFSRRREYQRVPIDMRSVVSEALKLLRATIPATVDFDAELELDTPTVLADVTQVQQVIMNLGTNAAHAMRDGPGRLTVRMKRINVDDALAEETPSLHAGSYVLLSVSDTGHGMDAATLSRIFEPFFTTKGPGEGTGLGLSAVHGIMQGHEGAVSVSSKVGQGTTFNLYFPSHEGSAIPLEAQSEVPRGSGQRILYVDDELPIAFLGKAILERLGYRVDTYTKPTDALAGFASEPKAYDLLVTDQMMPEMAGTALSESIHRLRSDLPIIVTTGYSATLTTASVARFGVRCLLAKPLSFESLGCAVHEVLAEKQMP